MNKIYKRGLVLVLILALCLAHVGFGQQEDLSRVDEIDAYIRDNFKSLKVPGLSVGIVEKGEVHYLNYGVKDLETKERVDQTTRYEIASISKSFTALGVASLESQGLINLQDPVSMYIDDFHGLFQGSRYEITIGELLYHTSGFGVETISIFREDTSPDALMKIAQSLSGTELEREPSQAFEYATINYAVLGAIIGQVTGQSYQDYMMEEVIGPLGMGSTFIGDTEGKTNMAQGHKISFFAPKAFASPKFRNNDPAGYIVSSAEDMVEYIRFQVGLKQTDLSDLLEKSHAANTNVANFAGRFYSYGWFNELNGFNELTHGGMNPNYATYISINENLESGIIILSNANSDNIAEFGAILARALYGGDFEVIQNRAGALDTPLSAFAIVFSVALLVVVALWVFIIYEVIKKKRTRGFERGSIKKIIFFIIFNIPLCYGIYIFPKAAGGFDWYTVLRWSTTSLKTCTLLIVASVIMCQVTYAGLLYFRPKNEYMKETPEIVLLGLTSGISNAIVIFLITSSLGAQGNIGYIVYYFMVALTTYIFARRTVEVKLANLSQLMIRNLREKIFSKLFTANLEEFEGMDTGGIVAVITNDIGIIGGLAGLVILLITSVITILAAFVFLATVSLFGTVLVIGVILLGGSLFSYLNYRAETYVDIARETQNDFLRKVEAMIGGFKDLVLHNNKKKEYREEISEINQEFVFNNLKAFRTFINAFMIGESLFIVVLGVIAFGFTLFFTEFSQANLTSFVLVLIYILGPLNAIINAMPRLIQIRVASDRVRRLLLQLPEKQETILGMDQSQSRVTSFEAQGVTFKYESAGLGRGFGVGPIDLKVKQGEILFVIGGNGSGKSTLIKLISGLYDLHEGQLLIDDQPVTSAEIGECISAVFADSFLFDKVYNCDLSSKEKMVNDYLRILELDEKVELVDGMFTTIALSTGQRKRLHLLRCFLEDKPIYIFDELAADQDPQFRQFFYRTMLPQMKEDGKIVIAVTHDDHYFDVADRVIKLNYGKIDDLNEHEEIMINQSIS